MNNDPRMRTVALYRIVRSNPPTLRDMMSNKALGREPLRPDPEVLRLWDGISVFDSATGARRQARQAPWRGQGFIATLLVPLEDFRLEKTRGEGHFTLWGKPHDILACVKGVEPI